MAYLEDAVHRRAIQSARVIENEPASWALTISTLVHRTKFVKQLKSPCSA